MFPCKHLSELSHTQQNVIRFSSLSFSPLLLALYLLHHFRLTALAPTGIRIVKTTQFTNCLPIRVYGSKYSSTQISSLFTRLPGSPTFTTAISATAVPITTSVDTVTSALKTISSVALATTAATTASAASTVCLGSTKFWPLGQASQLCGAPEDSKNDYRRRNDPFVWR